MTSWTPKSGKNSSSAFIVDFCVTFFFRQCLARLKIRDEPRLTLKDLSFDQTVLLFFRLASRRGKWQGVISRSRVVILSTHDLLFTRDFYLKQIRYPCVYNWTRDEGEESDLFSSFSKFHLARNDWIFNSTVTFFLNFSDVIIVLFLKVELIF
jgi:hypothetical protein